MTVGRPPKPTRLKLVEGNRGKRPISHNEPMPKLGAPEKPDSLSSVASAEWDHIVPELDRIGLLSLVDRAALVMYCEAVSIHDAALTVLNKSEILIRRGGKSAKDQIVKNPALQVARDAAQTARLFGAPFGLTPGDRARMTLPSGAGVDSIEDLLTRD